MIKVCDNLLDNYFNKEIIVKFSMFEYRNDDKIVY